MELDKMTDQKLSLNAEITEADIEALNKRLQEAEIKYAKEAKERAADKGFMDRSYTI
jgi:hypothetical protein